jgi:predicted aspartyl protease
MLDVSFLVDTGADRSLLNPPDARELGLESAELAPEIEIGGTTGGAPGITSSWRPSPS